MNFSEFYFSLIWIYHNGSTLFRCSDVLSEYSSTLSSGSAPPPDSTPKRGGAKGRSAVSSTSLLFQVLEEFMKSESNQPMVEALPIFLHAFLDENRSVKSETY